MSQRKPAFIDSPFFVAEPDNWHLKRNAPEEIKKEFAAFMKNDELAPLSVRPPQKYK